MVRVLAVIGGELTGTDERSEWGLLEALVAANAPDLVEVRLMAVVNRPGTSIVFGNPLGRAVGSQVAGPHGGGGAYYPSDSARQRLGRALEYVRGLGLQASGDIEPGHPYRAVRKEVAQGGYARVLFLVHDRPSWRNRLASRIVVTRLRRSLGIPVDVPAVPELAPPSS